MTVQQQAANLIYGLPDDSAQLVIDIINNLKAASTGLIKKQKGKGGIIIGLGKDIINCPDDFDKWDDEVAQLFEGIEE